MISPEELEHIQALANLNDTCTFFTFIAFIAFVIAIASTIITAYTAPDRRDFAKTGMIAAIVSAVLLLLFSAGTVFTPTHKQAEARIDAIKQWGGLQRAVKRQMQIEKEKQEAKANELKED